MSLIQFFCNNQWMAVGAIGHHGIHAAWRVEGVTGYVFAHALIQRQNETERIVLGPIFLKRDAMFTNVKVDAFVWRFLLFF